MAGVPETWRHEAVFDALDRGCGEVLLELRLRMAKLSPGTRLVIASRDAGAPVELPAWCRLTGHRLCEARPPST